MVRGVARIALLLVAIGTAGRAQAQGGGPGRPTATVPRVVRIDGQRTPPGAPSASAIEAVTLRLYDAETAGTLIWEEVQDARLDALGRYVVFLGATSPDGLPLSAIDGAPRWLDIRFARDVSATARVPLTSVPYALKAADADTLGGWPASAFVRAPATATATTGVTDGPGAGAEGASAAGDLDRPALNTGTANFLGKFVNALDLTSSVLYEGVGRIGLGTGAITPFDRLHVRFTDSSGGLTGLAVQNMAATGYSGMLFYDHTGALGQFQGFNNSTREYRINNIATGGSINFLLGGTSRLRIRPDGDLDINAASSIRKDGVRFLHGRGGLGAGALALNAVTSGGSNVAVGNSALSALTTGSANTAVGEAAMGVANGDNNVAIGFFALAQTTGTNNVAIGRQAGFGLDSGTDNIYIGRDVGPAVANEFNTVRIGTSASYNRFFLGGVRGVTTGLNNAVTVFIDSNGQLGTASSSRRYKTDIRDMGDASSGLMRLRPVTYRYRRPYADGSQPIEYGLIAEEVAEVYPDIVTHLPTGEIETVQYHKVNAMLLNEVQKQHRALAERDAELAAHRATIETQGTTLARQREELDRLRTRLLALERLVALEDRR